MPTNQRIIKCFYCHEGAHSFSAEVRQCAAVRNYQPLTSWRSEASSGASVVTISDIEELTTQSTPPFGHLLDGVAIARGHDRWDLVEQCATLAMASVTGEVPSSDVFYAARQMAIAHLREATLEDLAELLPRVVAELRSGPRFIAPLANTAIRSVEEGLEDLALLLTDDSAPSLIAAAARLRKLDRPDLAIIASTRAIDRNGTVAIALTVRSAAHLDQRKIESAKQDIERAEEVLPSSFTANVLARLEVGRKNLNAAESWALLANERDPKGIAGALSMMKIRTVQRRFDEASEWAQKAGRRSNWSVEWMRLQAANELLRGGNRSDAEAILIDLWKSGSYAPARRQLLELGHAAAA